MKRVVHMAVADAQVDMIHFDNTSLQAEPAILQHPLAIKDFRQHLGDWYNLDELDQRLGFADVQYIVPPRNRGGDYRTCAAGWTKPPPGAFAEL
jgi:hypothetical protein